jgi:hypothetical protein
MESNLIQVLPCLCVEYIFPAITITPEVYNHNKNIGILLFVVGFRHAARSLISDNSAFRCRSCIDKDSISWSFLSISRSAAPARAVNVAYLRASQACVMEVISGTYRCRLPLKLAISRLLNDGIQYSVADPSLVRLIGSPDRRYPLLG